MTNLEYYKDEINEIIENDRKDAVSGTIGNAFDVFSFKHIDNYPHRPDKFIDWLLEEHKEHKEPIKLKQWEYDLLKSFDVGEYTFQYFAPLRNMKEMGYFSDIENTEIIVKYILEDCVIVSDNYEGFEECK